MPTHFHRVMASEVTLFATQRQLGVELTCLRGTDDPFGDRATNTNADFTIRHNAGFAAWLTAARKAYRGKKVRSYCTIGGLDKKPDGCIDTHMAPATTSTSSIRCSRR